MSWILVTGAAKGFGRAICQALARKKHPIVIHYRTSEKEALETQKLCQQCGVQAELCQGDFETPEAVEEFINRYKLHFSETKGLVNNVGNFLVKPIVSTSEDEWISLMQTNVHAPFYLMRALTDSLIKHKGHIVNIGSSGLQAPRAKPTRSAYMITKMALWHLTLSFAKELAPDFVKVNMVSPGYLESAVDLKDPQALPMKRPATLEEAAAFVALLFDKESDYITGQNIEVAGGVGL